MPKNNPEVKKVLDVLNELNIVYTYHEHPPANTVEDAKKYADGIEGLHCKNLFLRNYKGDRHFLMITENEKPLKIKATGKKLGYGNLSFGSPERLKKYLGVVPGSVSPFGLVNDTNNETLVLLDKVTEVHELITFHPNDNRATLSIKYADLIKFLEWSGNPYKIVEL
ncbi:prolyl-tRNA synthetase associated domain-containing protein [Tindallia californiensis]|uniref:Ala-tRNA(Pro) deacylase n=1 Tax=Tindallia californiensis TaxID=159292 RepID=A0A1H3K895_9FIRM|nr:prolyl-tRNA synthetase associated domain-containing protein [Tindallia californiensis]SDY48381.1 Ala-tRNA(Pro) deacylase [Tindallia californiensis]